MTDVRWISDYADEAQRLLPGVAARGWAGDGFAAGVAPLSPIYDDLSGLANGLADLADADGYALDLAGDLEGEPRGGLGDAEYRRIIGGAQVVNTETRRRSIPRIRAAWVALTGADVVSVRTAGPLSVHMTALIDFRPTSTYLVRAGRILRRAVTGGVAIEALLYDAGTALYGDPVTGYGVGTYAWTVRT